MDGMYVTYYTGKAWASHAVFILKDEIISGADAMGGILDGSYEVAEDGKIKVAAMLKCEPGTCLVTGNPAEEKDGLAHKIVARLPRSFEYGHSIGIQTSAGPINAIFKKLQDVP